MREGPAEDGAESRAEGRSESAAIEAVLTVATEPVPPGLLAELLELPVERVEQLCRGLGGQLRGRRPRLCPDEGRRWVPLPEQ